MTREDGESGYALVAAVASIAVFAAMSLTVLAATRLALTDAGSEQAQLQAGAAADAGIAMAISGLLAKDVGERWSIDSRVRSTTYAGSRLIIRIEDERGKVPLNLLDEKSATALLENVGLSGDRLRIARDSLLDWTDEDEEARPFGAETAYYRTRHVYPPNGPLLTIDELGSVRGFDPVTIERINPIATVNFGFSSFDSRFASPRAIAIMLNGGTDNAQSIERARELSGQRPAIELAAASDLKGRPLTIAVDASLPGGGHAKRRAIVELTGSSVRPYVIRGYQ